MSKWTLSLARIYDTVVTSADCVILMLLLMAVMAGYVTYWWWSVYA